MPGPPPKDPAQRRRRNPTPGFKLLPHEGRKTPAPAWPFPGKFDEFEEQLWNKLWALPQAAEWERERCEETVALYVQTFTAAALAGGDTKLLAEARQWDAVLGISPKSMRALRWETDEPEDEEQPEVPNGNGKHRTYVPKEKVDD